jgi:hypothetical protein
VKKVANLHLRYILQEAKEFLDPIAQYEYSGDGVEAFKTLKAACSTAVAELAQLEKSTLEDLKAWEARLLKAQHEFMEKCPTVYLEGGPGDQLRRPKLQPGAKSNMQVFMHRQINNCLMKTWEYWRTDPYDIGAEATSGEKTQMHVWLGELRMMGHR